MKSNILTLTLTGILFTGCATVVPVELSDARAVYRRVSAGPASRLSPVELHAATQAMERAEASFQDEPDSYHTRDLSYVAQRKAELAEASASIAVEKEGQSDSKDRYQDAQGQIVDKAKADLTASKADLSSTQKALSASEKDAAVSAEKLAAEQTARAAADQRAAAAQASLAKLAAVKEEPRGLVITLSGSVLFASNNATLLGDARAKLSQVAEVLMNTRERRVVIEGHTDSQGSDGHNVDLSQRRADAVKDYLVSQGYQRDLVTSQGLGESSPVTGNDTAEGRANNRRVEIVIARESTDVQPMKP